MTYANVQTMAVIRPPVRSSMANFIKSMMGSQFVIPVYQRNYTWLPERETAKYMNDIEDLLARRTLNHFLGIIIYIESDISAMFKEIQIVDGQQRLTTSFIFLLSLKRLAQEQKARDVEGMIDDYYLYNRHLSNDARMRLKPAVSNDEVFAKLLYGNYANIDKRDRESNVYRNYEAIYQRIVKLSKQYSLSEILDSLSRIDILTFPLSDNDNAQQIFESINSTGAPLTSADLIRNYILMNDKNDAQERNYKMYWQPLERYFPDSRKLEEFFRYYLAVKTYNLLNKRDVYEGFKDYWKKSTMDREARMQDIGRYCRYFDELYNGPAEDKELENALADFRRNETHLPAPFLMEMYRMYDEKQIDKKTMIKQVRLIDSYLTRRALCGLDTGSLSRYFPQLLRSVMKRYGRKRSDIHEITKTFLINQNRGKSLAMPTDNEVRTRLKEVNAYSLTCIRPVLDRIEHHQATAKVDLSDLNIEHIMPQRPNAYWRKVIKVKNEEEYSYYANLIGNLTLCAEYDNTRMGNQDFNFKKKVLSKTLHIRMNTEILNKDTWTLQDILNRCDTLTNQILKIYPYEGGKDLDEDSRDADVIVMTSPSVNAKAIYHNEHSIEILSGSTMKAYGNKEMRAMRTTFNDLMGLGVLAENDSGLIQFEKNYEFAGLNLAAQFLLHRGGDNTAFWTKEDGKPFVPSFVDHPVVKKEDVTPKKPAEPPVKKEQPKQENKPQEQKKSSGKKKRPKLKPVPVVKEEAKEPPKIETRVFTKKKPEEEKKTEKQGFFRKIINDLKQ
ncbi:MAG: DUF262 domain-containing protein [Solobacterium sp.]|nr:DUF262 domain-containing protein [Solobacterium sp.]